MMMPEVLELQSEGDRLTLQLHLSPALNWFEGHFPDQPILPGVAQVNWVMLIAAQHFPDMGTFGGMEVLKFQKPLMPGEKVQLNIEWLKEKQRLLFSYRVGEQTASSGKILLCR